MTILDFRANLDFKTKWIIDQRNQAEFFKEN